MASPPFNPNQAQPAQADQGLTYPLQERTFRDIIESWIDFEHGTSGFHTFPIGNTTARNADSTWEVGSVFYNTDHNDLQVVVSVGPVVWQTNGLNAVPTCQTLFHQTAAPTGWTKQTDSFFEDAAIRGDTNTGVGGSTVFSTVLAAAHAAAGTVAAHTLTTGQMPSHRHTFTADTATLDDPPELSIANTGTGSGASGPALTDFVGGGGSHTHTWSGTIDLNVKFFDVILAFRNSP